MKYSREMSDLGLHDKLHAIAHLVSKAGSVISNKSPSRAFRWSGIYYIYIYAFSRRFYPKQLTLHSSYSFYILSALAFPGNRTHDLGVASAMLYNLSYRKAVYGAVDH